MEQITEQPQTREDPEFKAWYANILALIQEKPDTTEFDRRVNQLINSLEIPKK